jgi:hypothetical protein
VKAFQEGVLLEKAPSFLWENFTLARLDDDYLIMMMKRIVLCYNKAMQFTGSTITGGNDET